MTTPQHGELIADRYELLDRIGRGSAAEVWRALDRQSGQHVALKVLHERLTGDPAFVARFRREAQSAAALTHPNIARVYDFGRSGEHYYLAEELIDGSDLQRYLRTNAPLTPAQALNVAAQAAAGVAASGVFFTGSGRPVRVEMRTGTPQMRSSCAHQRPMASQRWPGQT